MTGRNPSWNPSGHSSKNGIPSGNVWSSLHMSTYYENGSMTRKIHGSIQSIWVYLLTMAHESHEGSILWAYVSYPNVEGLKKIEAIVLSVSEAFTTLSEACLCASRSSPWYNWTSNGENKIPSLWVPSHWFIRLCLRNSPLIRYVTQMNFKGGTSDWSNVCHCHSTLFYQLFRFLQIVNTRY